MYHGIPCIMLIQNIYYMQRMTVREQSLLVTNKKTLNLRPVGGEANHQVFRIYIWRVVVCFSSKLCRRPPLFYHTKRCPRPAPQIQLWCWHCAPYKCSYYYYYYSRISIAPYGRDFRGADILIFWGPLSHPLWRLRRNFAQPSGPTCPSALPSLTWIGATSHSCGAKNLIFGLWVNLIPAGCRFAGSCR